jgi:hypothetical protein
MSESLNVRFDSKVETIPWAAYDRAAITAAITGLLAKHVEHDP